MKVTSPTVSTLCHAFAVVAALSLVASASAQTTIQIPLNYNFNGIVHPGEGNGQPDDLNGYRSISDRGLNWDVSGGVPSDPLLDKYSLVNAAGVVDIVHLGNRNTVAGGSFPFDAVADGDNRGVQPAWLPNPDQTGPQTTLLGGGGITLDITSSATVIYQVSDGGGNFDVRLGFSSGADVVSTLSASDWFGASVIFGGFAGVDDVDNGGLGGALLKVEEGTINLAAEAGRTLTSITFENRSNGNAGYAIFGANVIVPEPTSLTLVLGGAIAMVSLRRKRS